MFVQVFWVDCLNNIFLQCVNYVLAKIVLKLFFILPSYRSLAYFICNTSRLHRQIGFKVEISSKHMRFECFYVLGKLKKDLMLSLKLQSHLIYHRFMSNNIILYVLVVPIYPFALVVGIGGERVLLRQFLKHFFLQKTQLIREWIADLLVTSLHPLVIVNRSFDICLQTIGLTLQQNYLFKSCGILIHDFGVHITQWSSYNFHLVQHLIVGRLGFVRSSERFRALSKELFYLIDFGTPLVHLGGNYRYLI